MGRCWSSSSGATGERPDAPPRSRARAAARLERHGVPDPQPRHRALVRVRETTRWSATRATAAYVWSLARPVCAPERLQDVVAEFAADARAAAIACATSAPANDSSRACAATSRHGTVGLGAQPSWDPRAMGRDRRASCVAARAAQSCAQQGRRGDAMELGARAEESGARARAAASGCRGSVCRRCIFSSRRRRSRSRAIDAYSWRRVGMRPSRISSRHRCPRAAGG